MQSAQGKTGAMNRGGSGVRPGSAHRTRQELRKTLSQDRSSSGDRRQAGAGSGLEKSSWTPLNHAPTNQQLFTERLALFQNWFVSWSDGQREVCLTRLLPTLNSAQVGVLHQHVKDMTPTPPTDFTRVLPRCISLYVFSFLDPRSLSRCARVCWYWKLLTEMDELWAHKCVRFAWNLPYEPSQFEQGAWKRLYVMKVTTLQLAAAKRVVEEEEAARLEAEREEKRQRRQQRSQSRVSKPVRQPLWKDPDPKPLELRKASRKLLGDPSKAGPLDKSNFLLTTEDGGTSSSSSLVGQLASDTNKALMMKTGPVNMDSITQPTLASQSRTVPATATIGKPFNVPQYAKVLSTAAPKTKSVDRLEAFKRTERHRKAVAEAVAVKQTSSTQCEPSIDQPGNHKPTVAEQAAGRARSHQGATPTASTSDTG